MEWETRFGPWLRQKRKALDLTQWDLAEQVGCSGSTIQKIEDGVRRPSRQVAELLVEILRVEPGQRDAFIRWARLGSDAGPDGPDGSDGSDGSSGPPGTGGEEPTRSPQATAPPAAPPPARQAASPTGNLPSPLTPLIGRESEAERLHEYLARPEVRLLTLTGPPGIGKTRLAIRAAADTARTFDGGVYFAGLAGTGEPEMVLPTIAQALGVQYSESRAECAVSRRVGDKRILLLLDNFEQVLDATPLILDLLGACPFLKLLITSREALRAPGEWRFPVPPLQLPLPSEGAIANPGALARVASVALFVQRAKAARPDFELTEENAGAVAAICTRLDGLPLAIELAAARMGLLTPAEIGARLDSRLKFLKGGSINLPARHRTLRGAIDWSYHLLSPAEQKLFRRVAVFSGGCSLQGVESVCGEDPGDDTAEDVDVLEAVASLVDKSLLTRVESESQVVWLEMLETIREYALERLEESGETENIRKRHAAYYVDLVETAAPEMFRGRKQEAWLARLERNFTNLSAAVMSAGWYGDFETIGRIAGSLWRFWYVRGHLNEARQWLNLALDNRERLSKPTLALAVHAMGVVVHNQGEFAQGYSYLQEALGLLKEVGNEEGVASALTNLGVVAHDRGDFVQARAYLEESLEVQREIGNRRGLAICLLNLGVIAAAQGDVQATRRFYEESFEVFGDLGDSQGIATALNNLGSTAFDEGDYRSAQEFFEEALAVRRKLGSRQGIASTLRSLADLAVESDDFASARQLAAESVELYRELGHKHGIADVLLTLGRACLAEGNLAQARANLAESLAIYNTLGSTADIALCLDAIAGLLMKQQPADPEKAACLYAAAGSLRNAIGVSLWPHPRSLREERIAITRSMLDGALFAGRWGEGLAMTAEQAVSYAVERCDARRYSHPGRNRAVGRVPVG